MASKCFSRLGEYDVKDAYARRKLDNSGIVAALGAKISETTGSDGFGTCIVMHDDKTCIVFDLGNDEGATLNAYLQNNDISVIDAIYISHFHSDHYQLTTLQSLIENYTVKQIVLPHAAIEWGRVTDSNIHHMDRYAEAKAAATAAGILCSEPIAEGEAFKHGDFDVTCHNVSPAYLEDYYGWMYDSYYEEYEYPMYNNFSMVNAVTYRNQKIIVTGDIMEPAVENTIDILNLADLIFVPHHGLEIAIPYAAFNRLIARHAVINSAYDAGGTITKTSLAFSGELIRHGCRVTTTYSAEAAANAVYEIKDGSITPIEPGVPAGQDLYPCAIKPGTDLDTLPDGEWITYSEAHAKTLVNVPPFTTSGRKFTIKVESTNRMGSGNRAQMATTIDTGTTPEIARRNYTGDEYKKWVIFSPSGYTRGSYTVTTNDELYTLLDTLLETVPVGHGIEVTISAGNGCDLLGGVHLCKLTNLYSNYAVAEFSTYTGEGRYRKCAKVSGEWKPMEWVNPTMYPGTEYRLTKRRNGKPVYAKTIEYVNDAILSGDSLTRIPHGVPDMDRSEGVEIKCRTQGFQIPYITAGESTSVSGCTATDIEFRTTGSTSWAVGRKWYFDMEYVKV